MDWRFFFAIKELTGQLPLTCQRYSMIYHVWLSMNRNDKNLFETFVCIGKVHYDKRQQVNE